MSTYTLTRAESLLYAAFSMLSRQSREPVSATCLAAHLGHKTPHAVIRMLRRLQSKNLLALDEGANGVWATQPCCNGNRKPPSEKPLAEEGAILSMVMPSPRSIQAAKAAINRHHPSRYAQALHKPFDKIQNELFADVAPGREKAQAFYANIGLIQRQLGYCLTRCSTPESQPAQLFYLMGLLSQHVLLDQPIVIDEKTHSSHHVPDTVLNEACEVQAFIDGIIDFITGKPTRYLEWLAHFMIRTGAEK